ncbi:MAG: hypothetical protein HY815_23050 [Candidatus Riflebacteria bacterium]|nr:hypothetical protein [Candidatus Riflebacteria bacterium]
MKQRHLEALDGMIDALRVIVDDPFFKPPPPAQRAIPRGLAASLARVFRFESEGWIDRALKEISMRSPFKVDELQRAVARYNECTESGDPRERSRWYRLAVAPVLVPKICGGLALLKFSAFEARHVGYCAGWAVQTAVAVMVVGWICPQLVLGVILWSILAILIDDDLDLEEVFNGRCLFSALTFVGNMELLMERCRAKEAELGALLSAVDRLVKKEILADPAATGESGRSLPSASPSVPIRVNLLKGADTQDSGSRRERRRPKSRR